MMAIACLFLTDAFAESVKKDTTQKAKAKQEVVKKEVIKKETKASVPKVATKDGIKQELYKDEQGSFYKCYLSDDAYKIVKASIYKEYFTKVIEPNYNLDKENVSYKSVIRNYTNFFSIWNEIINKNQRAAYVY